MLQRTPDDGTASNLLVLNFSTADEHLPKSYQWWSVLSRFGPRRQLSRQHKSPH